MKALKCRECSREYPLGATHVCEFDFGPLEVAYDYERIRQSLTRDKICSRPQNMWRYRELLPIAGEPTVGAKVGYTPLIKADRLAARLGIRELWIKNDAVNYPTLSFKDRVVSVALSRSVELGFKTVACASTGNAANAAAAGLHCYVFIPSDLEQGKVVNSLVYGANVVAIRGHYDEVNRLCAEIAGKYGWAFVNVNMRPYYAEGSKSMGFEIQEQLGWQIPEHTVVCMASGSLLTKIHKSYQEFSKLGLVQSQGWKIHGAQATGCSPITTAQKAGLDFFKSQTRSEVGSGKAFMAPKRSLSTGGGGEASASRGKRAPRVGEGAASRGVDGAVSRSAQSLQQAASHLAGGKGARGGAGTGSEDGGSSGSDGGAVGRVASERHRTPEQQVCLSLDSVCNGAPGLIAL